MAWNEELARSLAARFNHCGAVFEESEPRKELGFGCFIHEPCYDAVLEAMERGALGYSGEDWEPGCLDRQRAGFLDNGDDPVRRRTALERNSALFGQDAAKRMERLATWILKKKKNHLKRTV